jgi:hypothetical protein
LGARAVRASRHVEASRVSANQLAKDVSPHAGPAYVLRPN